MQNYIKREDIRAAGAAAADATACESKTSVIFSLCFSFRVQIRSTHAVRIRDLVIQFEYKMLPNVIRIATDPKVFYFVYY